VIVTSNIAQGDPGLRSGRDQPGLPIRLDGLTFELAHVQMVEEAAPVKQLLVAALLDDLTVSDDNYVVGVADCA
jgi:hypothetical protein